jgi:hypothetical protein
MGTLVKTRKLLSSRRKSLIRGFAPLLLLITFICTGQLHAQDPAVVLLQTQFPTLNQGQTGTVLVQIEGASDVFGVQIDLTFDASRIKVIDENEAKPGVQILAGDFLIANEGFEAVNEANNEDGRLQYAYTRLAPAEPVSGSGTLFEFQIEALQPGPVDIQFGQAIVASPLGEELPVQLEISTQGSGAIFVPNDTPSAPAGTTAISTMNPPTSTAVAESTAQPAASLASPAGDAPTMQSPASGSTLPATAASTAQVPAVGDNPESASPAPAANDQAEQVPGSTTESPISPTAEAVAESGLTAELTAVPAVTEEDKDQQAEEAATPPLAVIGQNQTLEKAQTQAPTPAPSAESEGKIEGITLAAGLIGLSIALIAFWFFMRIRTRS